MKEEIEQQIPPSDYSAKRLYPDKSISQYSSREIGVEGEHIACIYLQRQGYKIIDKNWRSKFGEVDIIAYDPDGVCVLIEVKTRRTMSCDTDSAPELAVTFKKQEKYRKLAMSYFSFHPELKTLRFDVIAVNILANDKAHVHHLISAYACDEYV